MIKKRSIGLLVLLLGFGCAKKKENELKIDPPFKNITIATTSITIQPNIQQIIKFENGVSVEIPENAFVDSNGNTIKEPVTLSLNTFTTPAEIIASGIPMTYSNDSISGTFESAGMFEITGKTATAEVFIDAKKALTISNPSKIYGDYDFFQFEVSKNDSIKKGQWKKLRDNTPTNAIPEAHLNTFQLKLDTINYPELIPLSNIQWKLATKYSDPKTNANQWILEKQWQSIEVSKPKYGFADSLFMSKVNYDGYLQSGAMVVTKDKSRIITTKTPVTKIWTREGKLLKTIDKVNTDYEPVEILNEKIIIIERRDGDYIYNLNGEELGKLPACHNRTLAHKQDIILYNKNGTDPTVYLFNIKDKTTKSIALREDLSGTSTGWNVFYPSFYLTKEDELITASADGIIIYDLNGKKNKQKKVRNNYFEYIENNQLKISELDGTLTIWNYKTDKEITSKREFFNFNEKRFHSAYSFSKPNSPFIIINIDDEQKSIIWNYEINEIDRVSFEIRQLENDSIPPNVVVGYNSKENSYHLYDCKARKDIITIPNYDYNINYDGSFYKLRVSPDQSRLLLTDNKYCRLYDSKGALLRDFKKLDSLINTAGFVKNDTIFSVSEDGIYRRWDKNGQEISSKKLKNSEYIYSYFGDNKILTQNVVFTSRNDYDVSGSLYFSPSRYRLYEYVDATSALFLNSKKEIVLQSLFPLEPNVHQLVVRTNDSEFITYVYLNDSDWEKINHYYTIRAKRINKEKERQEEEVKTLRRFQINQFGIYNWDRLMKQDNYVSFEANFKFPIPTAYNNITVFLVTAINGPVVVKYDSSSWDKFGLNPKAANKLIAILPDNKVAVFDQFDKLNYATILKDKKYTFNMKIIDKPITNLKDLETILE